MKQRSKHHATGNSHSSSSTGLGTALWAHGSFSDIDEFDEADEEEADEEEEEVSSLIKYAACFPILSFTVRCAFRTRD